MALCCPLLSRRSHCQIGSRAPCFLQINAMIDFAAAEGTPESQFARQPSRFFKSACTVSTAHIGCDYTSASGPHGFGFSGCSLPRSLAPSLASSLPPPSRPKFKPPQSEGAGRGLVPHWGPDNREGGFCSPPPPPSLSPLHQPQKNPKAQDRQQARDTAGWCTDTSARRQGPRDERRSHMVVGWLGW